MHLDRINFIGEQVSHVNGGEGQIVEDLGVAPFSGVHLFRVSWNERDRQEVTAVNELLHRGTRLSDAIASLERSLATEARRIAAQEKSTETVRQLLRRGHFRQADLAYESCADFWPRNLYQRERESHHAAHGNVVRERWAARFQRLQEKLRSKVVSLLKNFDIEGADLAFKDCHPWWSIAEFETLRAQAIRIKYVVETYPSASLADLDVGFNERRNGHVSADDYARLKLPKLKLRLARLGMPLDEEQLLACARPEQHRLIRARAGSGKTRTLAALAALTIHDEALNPDQVLILAFNKKAANEIGDRVRGAAGIDEFRNARTFHSLAWQLADHAGRDLIFDDGNLSPSRRKQTGFMERLMVSIMNPAFRERLYEFFRRELEQMDRLGSNLSKEEYVVFRRSLATYTLGGDTVKSNGEKFIADFLFEQDIAYKYEKVWSWDKQDRLRGAAYRPDFSISYGGRDFILEHWAIDPVNRFARLPDWWEMETQDYRDQIEDKRKHWAMRGIQLLETHAGMLASGREAFETLLMSQLKAAGVRCQKLPHDELVRRIGEAPRTVSRMAELFLQFISRAKKRGWTVEDVSRIVRDTPDPEPRNHAFHELAVHAYAAYERQLVSRSAMDFDDLLISAAKCVQKEGNAAHLKVQKDYIAVRDLRWILIDEFQDFSELYYRVIHAILKVNPSIRVVAVGDDWQAINGFAGAQLTFFNQFGKYFPGAGAATISKNRRSGRAIVGASNQLMVGHGDSAKAHHDFDGVIEVRAIDKVWPESGSTYAEIATSVSNDGRKSINWELAKALKACVDCIAKSVLTQGLHSMPSVLIVARTGRAYGETLTGFSKCLERALRCHPDLQGLANHYSVIGGQDKSVQDGATLIEVMTAHRAKGKEAGTVIVLEADMRQFPKVHADNQLFRPFGVTAEDVIAEERRLFYVAATRAMHSLIFLTETDKESPYLAAMRARRTANNQAEGNGAQLGVEALMIKAHLDQANRELFIRQNVSQQAVSAWDRITGRSLGAPEIGHSLSDGYYAELVWLEHAPPIAILTGHHRVHAKRWQEAGWEVR